MESEGIVVDTPALGETFEAAGWLLPITPKEFHAFLDILRSDSGFKMFSSCCRPRTSSGLTRKENPAAPLDGISTVPPAA